MREAVERQCAACGKPLADRGARALFCDRACKQALHNVWSKRGSEVLAYLQVWRGGKNARSPEAKALASYAFSELCSLADSYNAEDREAGRDAAAVLQPRYDRRENWRDRKPAAEWKPTPQPGLERFGNRQDNRAG